jgi:hypothetical protein
MVLKITEKQQKFLTRFKGTKFSQTLFGRAYVKKAETIFYDIARKKEIKRVETSSRGGTTPAYGFEQLALVTGIPSAYNLIRTGVSALSSTAPVLISDLGKPSIYAFGRFGTTTITKNITKTTGGKWLLPALFGGGALGFLLGGGGSIDQKQEAALTQAAAPQEAAPQNIYNVSPQITKTYTKTFNYTTANYNQWLNVEASGGSTISGILQSASTSPVSYVTPTVSPQQTIDLSALQEQIQALSGQIGQEQTAEQGMNPLILAAIVIGGAFLISGGLKDG